MYLLRRYRPLQGGPQDSHSNGTMGPLIWVLALAVGWSLSPSPTTPARAVTSVTCSHRDFTGHLCPHNIFASWRPVAPVLLAYLQRLEGGAASCVSPTLRKQHSIPAAIVYWSQPKTTGGQTTQDYSHGNMHPEVHVNSERQTEAGPMCPQSLEHPCCPICLSNKALFSPLRETSTPSPVTCLGPWLLCVLQFQP